MNRRILSKEPKIAAQQWRDTSDGISSYPQKIDDNLKQGQNEIIRDYNLN